MNIALKFTYQTDIISVPNEIAVKINKIQQSFDKWLYDKDNDHGHWIIIDGKKIAVSFDSETFVNYINDFYLKDKEKVVFDEKDVDYIPADMMILYF